MGSAAIFPFLPSMRNYKPTGTYRNPTTLPLLKPAPQMLLATASDRLHVLAAREKQNSWPRAPFAGNEDIYGLNRHQTINKMFQQSVAGYPPQGVGSPER